MPISKQSRAQVQLLISVAAASFIFVGMSPPLAVAIQARAPIGEGFNSLFPKERCQIRES